MSKRQCSLRVAAESEAGAQVTDEFSGSYHRERDRSRQPGVFGMRGYLGDALGHEDTILSFFEEAGAFDPR